MVVVEAQDDLFVGSEGAVQSATMVPKLHKAIPDQPAHEDQDEQRKEWPEKRPRDPKRSDEEDAP